MTAPDRLPRPDTAPADADRPEVPGLWHEHPGAPPRAVVVALGRSTLLLADPGGAPLGHWALAGIVRVRRDEDGALYSMTADATETLGVHDDAMIEAIAARASPHLTGARRRRVGIGTVAVAAGVALLVAAAVQYLPTEAARLVPEREAAALGDDLLALLAARTCATAEPAAPAVVALATRLAAAPPRAVVTLPVGTPASLLPGGTLVLDRGFAASARIEDIARSASEALANDPLASAFAAAGRGADLRFLVTGRLDDAALARAADAIAAPGRGCAPR